MSPSAYITKRQTQKSGQRFVVRFRLGGRYSPLIHAGSFKMLKDAKARRDFVIAEMAAGRNPIDTLRALQTPARVDTLTTCFDRFIESRVDVGGKAIALYKNARNRLGRLADADPTRLSPADIQEWMSDNAHLAPRTIRHYLGSIRQVLEFADVEPNPAKSKKIRVPSLAGEEPSPPSRTEWDAAKAKVTRTRVRLALRLIECLALRVGETCQLTWGDIDFAEGRFRISRARSKAGSGGQRWLPVPDELLEEIEALVPLEDRYANRLVLGVDPGQIRSALERACKLAGVAHYHPHDLRHRRISLWLAHGIDPIAVKTWAGHTKASMSLDTYGHVMVDALEDEWREFWIATYVHAREARVRSREDWQA